MQQQGLVLSVYSDDLAPINEIYTLARERIFREIGGSDEVETICQSVNQSGYSTLREHPDRNANYRTLLLAHYIQEGFAVTGLAVLALDKNPPCIFQNELVDSLSKALIACGDVPKIASKP